MNQGTPITLTDEQRNELERRARSQTLDARSVRRARIVLFAAAGMGNHEIARRLEISRGQVITWCGRFAEGGVEAIRSELPRSGRKPTIDASKIVRVTTQTTPEGATHWSTRKLAAKLGISDTTVLKVWQAHGLEPHLVETFKVSRDPKFVEKLEDIVGLYMSPPEHALVLCCDEKSQVQALDRNQPGLPLKKGRASTMTHDYKRNGTTTLFAVLNVLDGQVIAQCQQRHRHRVASVLASDRSRDARGQGFASGLRQLHDTQASGRPGVAEKTSALPYPFHPDLRFQAQHDRALLPRYLD